MSFGTCIFVDYFSYDGLDSDVIEMVVQAPIILVQNVFGNNFSVSRGLLP